MPLRPRSVPADPVAAARVEALLVAVPPWTSGDAPPADQAASAPPPGEPVASAQPEQVSAPDGSSATDRMPAADQLSANRPVSVPGRWAARLPEPLRGGRWDPGRRGANALAGVALLAALVAALVVLHGRPQQVVTPPVEGAPAAPAAAPATTGSGPVSAAGPAVVVAVAGKVHRPGLVRLPAGARVDDAVRAAGGTLPGADIGLLNLARKLVDGEQVLVAVPPQPGTVQTAPGEDGGAAAGGAATGTSPAGGQVDLNAATVSDFDALPGIGPVLAQRIADWRTEHGRFASVDQLREVSGIGESKFASLKSKVRV